MNLHALTATLLLAALPAFAGDLNGNWTGSVQTAAGPVRVDYVLTATETALTGTAPGPDGSSIPLKDGKIDGNRISFALDIIFGSAPATTYKYTGIVSGSEIKVHTEYMGRPIDFTLRRAG
ncbi:MAG TPA: hypothetical protein VGM97_15865 [Steroidobacteraceae bacterium]|jgi:hypothetical protein